MCDRRQRNPWRAIARSRTSSAHSSRRAIRTNRCTETPEGSACFGTSCRGAWPQRRTGSSAPVPESARSSAVRLMSYRRCGRPHRASRTGSPRAAPTCANRRDPGRSGRRLRVRKSPSLSRTRCSIPLRRCGRGPNRCRPPWRVASARLAWPPACDRWRCG